MYRVIIVLVLSIAAKHRDTHAQSHTHTHTTQTGQRVVVHVRGGRARGQALHKHHILHKHGRSG